MNRTSITILFSLLVFSSCTTLDSNSDNGFASVDLNFNKFEESSAVIDPKDNVGTYGPIKDVGITSSRSGDRPKSLGVIIGPSLYKSIEAVDVLKCFEKLDRKVNLISGVGYSLIVAGLYAQGDSPEQIKWKLYKELRNKKLKPFSRKWLDKWTSFINKNVNKKKLLVSSRSLWIPEFNKSEGLVNYTSKGNLLNKIIRNLDQSDQSLPLKKNFLSNTSMKKLPVERVVIINTLSDRIELGNDDDYLLGLYGKIYSTLKRVDNSNILMININTNGALDSKEIASNRRDLLPICTQLEEVL